MKEQEIKVLQDKNELLRDDLIKVVNELIENEIEQERLCNQ